MLLQFLVTPCSDEVESAYFLVSEMLICMHQSIAFFIYTSYPNAYDCKDFSH